MEKLETTAASEPGPSSKDKHPPEPAKDASESSENAAEMAHVGGDQSVTDETSSSCKAQVTHSDTSECTSSTAGTAEGKGND